MAYLIPNKIITAKIGTSILKIKQKITPDGAKASKRVCSYVRKGDLVKPNAKLNNGTGKPKGITVHNTHEIRVSSATTPAEQYARATYPNGNMGGAAVHYWVWHSDIWQQLADDERGWHAADGSSRRTDHRGNKTGGNLDTIAIECIGKDAESEETLTKLVAYLCEKYSLDPEYDVYTHNYWMYGVDKKKLFVRKNCPAYILNHWEQFLDKVKIYKDLLHPTKNEPVNPIPATPVVKDKSKAMVMLNILKKGSKGTEAKALQALLIGYGCSVGRSGADGIFGKNTQITVKKYQTDNNLVSDGCVGSITWRKLLGV